MEPNKNGANRWQRRSWSSSSSSLDWLSGFPSEQISNVSLKGNEDHLSPSQHLREKTDGKKKEKKAWIQNIFLARCLSTPVQWQMRPWSVAVLRWLLSLSVFSCLPAVIRTRSRNSRFGGELRRKELELLALIFPPPSCLLVEGMTKEMLEEVLDADVGFNANCCWSGRPSPPGRWLQLHSTIDTHFRWLA